MALPRYRRSPVILQGKKASGNLQAAGQKPAAAQ
jgi:hypothetical protein